jgi:hypothetical protein
MYVKGVGTFLENSRAVKAIFSASCAAAKINLLFSQILTSMIPHYLYDHDMR